MWYSSTVLIFCITISNYSELNWLRILTLTINAKFVLYLIYLFSKQIEVSQMQNYNNPSLNVKAVHYCIRTILTLHSQSNTTWIFELCWKMCVAFYLQNITNFFSLSLLHCSLLQPIYQTTMAQISCCPKEINLLPSCI